MKSIIVSVFALAAISVASAAPYLFMQAESPIQNQLAAVQQQTQNQDTQFPHKIGSHLNQLVSHGGSAVRSVVNSVQPDLKNIGQDISEVYKATRGEVNKHIEPLAQTVRPFIENAQKAVAPYVDHVKQDVPKLLNQAGPTLSKVGQQVRSGISGAWDKLTSGAQAATSHLSSANEQIARSSNEAGQQLQNSALDAAKEIGQIGKDTSNAVQAQVQSS